MKTFTIQSRGKSIQAKLLALILLSVGIPMLVFIVVFQYYSRSQINEQSRKMQQSSLQTSADALQQQIQLVSYAARGVYFNSDVLDILADRVEMSTVTQRQAAEDYIFNMMQTIYSVVPDASVIRLSSARLASTFYLNQSYDRIILPENRQASVSHIRPYSSRLVSGASSVPDEYINERAAFTVRLPLYDPPSITDCMGEIDIVIPYSRLEALCAGMFDEQGGEALYLLLGKNIPLYSSTGSIPNWVMELVDDQTPVNVCLYRQAADGSTAFYEHIREKTVDVWVVRAVPSRLLQAQANSFVAVLLALLLAVLAMTVISLVLSTLSFTRPLKKLAAYTCEVNRGHLDARIEDFIVYPEQDEIGTLVQDIDAMMHTINHYIIREYRLYAANKNIQLQMLQAQINPHFLHNTLQCLAGEALDANAPHLYGAIAALGQMMQYAMDTEHMTVPLSLEREYAAHYLKLQCLRFSCSLDVRWDISDRAANVLVPKMLLQPLIENSIRHGGILRRPGCSLRVCAALQEEGLLIEVTDDGDGLAPDRLAAVQKSLRAVREHFMDLPAGGINGKSPAPARDEDTPLEELQKNVQIMQSHIGLANVYERLLLHFGRDCRIDIRALAPHGAQVALHIPLQTNREEAQT